MSSWDVFHSDRLTVDRGLSTDQVRSGLASGAIRDDDLIRAAGSSAPWGRLADVPELTAPAPEPEVEPSPEEEPEEIVDPEPAETTEIRLDPEHRLDIGVDNPVPQSGFHYADLAEMEPLDPVDEDDEAAGFTLSRSSAEKIEELDLAAMVDVAFQLVLFFLVTATTILYKSLEVPKPNPEQQEAATQGKSPSDLKGTYIVVKIDSQGTIRVDDEPVAPENLIEKLRRAREDTDRRTMLLSADFNAMHKICVQAYDAANEIGLGIALARPVEPAAAKGG